MFPMQPMEKLASISANFQKTSKVSISVTLFQVLKDLDCIFAVLSLVVYRSVLWNPWNQEECVGWENNCSYA